LRGRNKATALAPFQVRSFRFQWPADLLTSWAFEMETLVLGWYILVETESVLLLTLIGALQFIGTLIAPMFGVLGDRIGRRTLLCLMRATYTILATTMMGLGLSGMLTPYHVFGIVFLAGLVRQSDLVMRNALIGDTMPKGRLMSAISLSRTTQDTARIAGALAGAGLFSILGIGATYIFVASFYAVSLALTFGVARPIQQTEETTTARPSPWGELKEGLAYAWRTPNVRAIVLLAFLVNLTAYPATNGLLPYAAKEIYHVGANGLGHLVAGFACGAFIGSLLLVWTGGPRRTARFTLINLMVWYALLIGFAQLTDKIQAMSLLLVIGIVQGTAMISMSVTLLNAVAPQYRGRIMGVRMLAVYGLPLGLMIAGGIMEPIGYPALVTLYCCIGASCVAFIGVKYREILWH
jgi:MFS family permease